MLDVGSEQALIPIKDIQVGVTTRITRPQARAFRSNNTIGRYHEPGSFDTFEHHIELAEDIYDTHDLQTLITNIEGLKLDSDYQVTKSSLLSRLSDTLSSLEESPQVKQNFIDAYYRAAKAHELTHKDQQTRFKSSDYAGIFNGLLHDRESTSQLSKAELLRIRQNLTAVMSCQEAQAELMGFFDVRKNPLIIDLITVRLAGYLKYIDSSRINKLFIDSQTAEFNQTDMDRKGFADEHILGTMIIVTRDPTIVDKIIHDPSFTAEQLETKLAQGFAL